MGARKSRAGLPTQLGTLILCALVLGTFSISQLHSGGAGPPTGTLRAEVELLHLNGGVASQEPQPQAQAQQVQLQDLQQTQAQGQQQEQQGQQQPQQEQEQSGTCFTRYAWIQPALDVWFEKAWAAANESTQTTEQALQKLRDSMWNKYHPGMDEVILRLDEKTGRVVMDVLQIAPPNQPHKKKCMLALLKDAVEVHNAELAALLGGREKMHLIVETEDFGVTWKAQKNKIPAFAMCTDDRHTDIPVPDFTYYCYPEARYKNSSWPAIQALLQYKSDMVPWHERNSELFHRSNWNVGPRRGLMPLLESYDNGTAPISSKEAFGCELDIENTGFVNVRQGQALRKHDSFVWLDGQCDYKYLIHTAGFSYSAGLKYKLACGSMVFKFESTYKEFYEPALVDQFHVVKLPSQHVGVDVEQFRKFTAPAIKAVVSRTINLNFQPPIPSQGQAFVREQLTMEALYCYWLGALQRYAELYFLPKTARQLAMEAGGAAQQGAGGSSTSGGGVSSAGAAQGSGGNSSGSSTAGAQGGSGGGSTQVGRRLDQAGLAGGVAEGGPGDPRSSAPGDPRSSALPLE